MEAMRHADRLVPGTRLGAYEITRFLAAGGMSEIYVARDTKLGRDVAIKFLPKAFGTNPLRVHRFEHEIRATTLLNHPNIVSIFDVGESESGPYFVTELLEGRTLRDELERRGLAVPEALSYAFQIARGLAAAHDKGIVHRDLKPGNIFITADGHVKILDFGLAKVLHPERENAASEEDTVSVLTYPGVIAGSAGYISPEQVQGVEVTHRADIFAFGAVLYEMFTGRRAFHGPTQVETLHAILKDDPPEPASIAPELPDALSRTVMRCLAKSPQERFDSVRDLLFTLREVAVAPDPQRRIRIPVRRIGRALVLAAPLAGLLALGTSVFREQPSKPQSSLEVTKLTEGANVSGFALSLDRRFLAYGAQLGGAVEVRLKHLPTRNEIVLVPQAPGVSRSVRAISPDGNFVYYREGRGDGPTFKRVSIVGGDPFTVVSGSGINPGFALSPDGRRIVFARSRRATENVAYRHEIFTADADGGNRRWLATLHQVRHDFISHFDWSPDGRKISVCFALPIAFSATSRSTIASAGGTHLPSVVVIDTETGQPTTVDLPEEQRPLIAFWTRDSTALLAGSPGRRGILRIEPATGDWRWIASLDVTAALRQIDDDTFLGTTGDEEVNLWLSSTATGAVNRLTKGGDTADGRSGLAILPHGRIVYTVATDASAAALWIANADGSNPRQLTRAAAGTFHERVDASPREEAVIFIAFTDAGQPNETRQLLRLEVDNGESRVLVTDPTLRDARFAPDGQTVIYTAGPETAPSAWALTPGQHPRLVLRDCAAHGLDPTGSMLACCDAHSIEYVATYPSGARLWTRDLPAETLQWTRDGKLAYIEREHGVGNLRLQSLDASSPVPLTFFTTDLIYQFAWTPGGSGIVISRGGARRDVTLIRGFDLQAQ